MAIEINFKEIIKNKIPNSFSLSIIGLVLILLLAIFLRYPLAKRNYIWPWDEAVHALVAKNFKSNILEPRLYPKESLIKQDYKDWVRTSIWLDKPPMSMWLMNICFKLFGEGEFVIRLPSLIMDMIGIVIIFILGTILFNNISGLFAALLYALNPFLILLSVGLMPTDHIDIALLFFELLVIFCYVFYKKYEKIIFLACSGICFGFALLSRSVSALIVIVILFTLELSNQKRNFKNIVHIFLIGLIISLPWYLYTFLKWPEEFLHESNIVFMHFDNIIDGHGGDIWYYFSTMPRIFGSVIYLFLILLSLYWLLRNKQLQLFWFLLCWIMVPILFFSVPRTKMEVYILISYPAIFLLISYIPYYLVNQKLHLFFKISLLSACILMLLQTFMATSQIEINGDTGYLYFKPNCYFTNIPYDYDNFRRNMLNIKAKKEKAVIFNIQNLRYIQAMYYSGCLAYDFLPNEALLKELNKQNYKIYVVVNKYLGDLAKIKIFDNFAKKNHIKIEYIYIEPNYLVIEVLSNRKS